MGKAAFKIKLFLARAYIYISGFVEAKDSHQLSTPFRLFWVTNGFLEKKKSIAADTGDLLRALHFVPCAFSRFEWPFF